MRRKEIIESLPNIPDWDFWTPYTSVCDCGGTLLAYRSILDTNTIKVSCNNCGFKKRVNKLYVKPTQNKN